MKHPTSRELFDYVDTTSDRRPLRLLVRVRVWLHLTHCQECRRDVAGLEELEDTMRRRRRHRAPEGLITSIQRRLAELDNDEENAA